jgi:N-acetyl-alpha-D-muramate 1-phosphate uridylyltransferase
MNAMIFAAGLGTRLQPLTQNMPKALVQVHQKPLLAYAIDNVVKAGATRVVVNVHHFPEQIAEYIEQHPVDGVEIVVSDERDLLLETGGGLLKAAPLFLPHQPILVHNADVLTNCDLSLLVSYHRQQSALATLMVAQRKTSRYLLFHRPTMRLAGWQNKETGQLKGVESAEGLLCLAFNGIHIVDYRLLEMLGKIRKFSITDGYLQLAANEPIVGWAQWKGLWYDIGTLEKLQKAQAEYPINL